MSVDTTNADEVLIAVSGDVYVAPVGTPLPALVRAALSSSFTQIGYVSEDGVSLAVAPDIDQQAAWQETNPVRFDLVEQRIAVTFDMLQWNAENVVWAFGGTGTITEFVPNGFRYDFPDSNDAGIDERSIVIDWEDGEKVFRLVFARGTVLGGLSTSLNRSGPATLPVGFDVLAADATGSPGYMFLSATTPPFDPGDPPPPPPPPEDDDLLGEGLLGEGLLGGV